MANIYWNYLQVVRRGTLEITSALVCAWRGLPRTLGLLSARPKQSRFHLSLQLGAKCLVSCQLTVVIFKGL